MPAAVDITGERYGRLVALRKTHTKHYPSGQARAVWLFKCDCGNETEKTAFDVRRADTSSCGCAKFGKVPGNRLEKGEASFRGLMQRYKRSAKIRGHSWGLGEEEFRRITRESCAYCGASAAQEAVAHRSAFGAYAYNGVDRVDSRVGYEPGNVVPCCQTCNRAKGVMPAADFLAWVARAYAHQVNGGSWS